MKYFYNEIKIIRTKLGHGSPLYLAKKDKLSILAQTFRLKAFTLNN